MSAEFRLVFALILFLSSIFAFIQADMGKYSVPKPVRRDAILLRRLQLFCYLIVSCIVMAYSEYLTETDNYLSVCIVILLEIVLVFNVYRWWRMSEIIIFPISPTTEELVTEAVNRARQIAHTSKDALNIVTLTLETIENNKSMSCEDKHMLKIALLNLESISGHIDEMHGQIKALYPITENMDAVNTKND